MNQTTGQREPITRPILFSGPMVRAILNESKTQTRRLIAHQPIADFWVPYRCPDYRWNWVVNSTGAGSGDPFKCPFGKPGDRLYVRETWGEDIETGKPCYAATPVEGLFVERWRPSIHMPRRFSRITLEVTNVRVERLRDISEQDARAEGVSDAEPVWPPDRKVCPICHGQRVWDRGGHEVDCDNCATYRDRFALLWCDIDGGSWANNDWVWVVEFKRIQP